MELWDLYDRDREKTGLSQIRGEPTIVILLELLFSILNTALEGEI